MVRTYPGPPRQEKPQCTIRKKGRPTRTVKSKSGLGRRGLRSWNSKIFLMLLTLRIIAEAEPTTRACWRAHKAATGAEIRRLRGEHAVREPAYPLRGQRCATFRHRWAPTLPGRSGH